MIYSCTYLSASCSCLQGHTTVSHFLPLEVCHSWLSEQVSMSQSCSSVCDCTVKREQAVCHRCVTVLERASSVSWPSATHWTQCDTVEREHTVCVSVSWRPQRGHSSITFASHGSPAPQISDSDNWLSNLSLVPCIHQSHILSYSFHIQKQWLNLTFLALS